jgi:NAD(P)-dependent dehydrogenase (short-subunit alcohol dehydrogenase family)
MERQVEPVLDLDPCSLVQALSYTSHFFFHDHTFTLDGGPRSKRAAALRFRQGQSSSCLSTFSCVSGPVHLFDLGGKVAVVTGGSRGMGAQMVRAFAAAGADVVIASRKLEACQALADEIVATTGKRALARACHVGEWDQVEQLADAAYEAFGQVDVLVNNAGMSPLYDHVVDVTEALYDKVLDVNLKGAFRLTAVVGTRMAAGDGGSIINVSSGGAVRPSAGIIPYAAAKAGLNAMTIGFAHAFGPSVRVNCIQSGPVLTDIAKAWDPALLARGPVGYALGRFGQPEEIVGAALYFASDASSFTTGAILAVDGGMP